MGGPDQDSVPTKLRFSKRGGSGAVGCNGGHGAVAEMNIVYKMESLIDAHVWYLASRHLLDLGTGKVEAG